MPLRQVSNTLLRLATLGSKFLLIFGLARFLAPEQVGLYGLLTAGISYAIYPVGLEFHTYAIRDLISVPQHKWAVRLKGQAALSALAYMGVLPLLFGIFILGLLPWHLLPWFLLLLPLEHAGLELDRLLVATRRPLAASTLLFIRQGIWPLTYVLAMTIYPQARTLNVGLALWSTSAIVAVGVGFLLVRALRLEGWRLPVDRSWIVRGLRVAAPLLLSLMTVRFWNTADRFWLEQLTNAPTVGAYVLFVSVANGLTTITNSAVHSFIYPELVHAYAAGDQLRFRANMRRMSWQTSALSGAFVLLTVPLMWNVDALGLPAVYTEQRHLFPWVLGAVVLQNLSAAPHYGLYARYRDRSIAIASVTSLLVFVVVTESVSLVDSGLAVPAGLLGGSLSMLMGKMLSYHYLMPFKNERIGK